MERLHILDGYGYIFRAFYGLMGSADRRGVRLSTASGMPTGALYVYANMLIRLYLDVKPQRIAVVFDAPGPSFRSDIDESYKATRTETPDDLKIQMPYFRPLTEAFNWPVLAVPGVEADDVIATLARRARDRDWDVVIYSGDKDLMQLVDDHVVVIDSMRDKTYDAPRVEEKFGVPPHQVGDYLALVGDTSDNIPGMKGVGAKTAAKLLGTYGSIDAIFEHTGELKGKMKERFETPELVDQVRLSQKLVRLEDHVDVDVALDDLVPGQWDGAALTKLFKELEFQVLLARLDPTTAAAGAEAEGAPVEVEAIPEPELLLDAGAVRAFAADAAAAGRLAVQVETDGARPDRARVVGVGMAVPDRAPVYLPLEHRYLTAPQQLTPETLPEELRRVLGDPSVAKVAHDVKAARKALARIGLPLEGLSGDPALETYLLDASRDAYALDRVVAGAIGVKIPTRKALLGKGKNRIGFEAVTVEDAAAYAGAAAYAVMLTDEVLGERLAGAGLTELYRDLELPLTALLADVEQRGITLDTEYLRGLSDEMGAEIAALERQIYELAGTELNLGSPKQLSHVLFEQLGLQSDRMRKTKTGYSTDHDVLESLVHAHPVIQPILDHRELVKLKSTYLDALPPLVNPATGRIHTTFAQAIAATGRLSSQDPNLQNIPIRSELGRKIRRAFVAAEGTKLVSADYSQIELRIVAHLSGDPVLTRAFREGIDVHTQTAAEVFGIPLEEVGAHERNVAKAVNYGLIYGQSPFGLARALDIPRSEAQHYIDRYFERFATVRAFTDRCIEDARASGYATTIMGRRRPIPDIKSKNFGRRRAAERVAQNTPMQGSGADILKLAMLEVQRRIEADRIPAQMLLTVHDELVFEVEAGAASEFAAVAARVMEDVHELDVPLVVDVGIADDWSSAH